MVAPVPPSAIATGNLATSHFKQLRAVCSSEAGVAAVVAGRFLDAPASVKVAVAGAAPISPGVIASAEPVAWLALWEDGMKEDCLLTISDQSAGAPWGMASVQYPLVLVGALGPTKPPEPFGTLGPESATAWYNTMSAPYTSAGA